MKQTCHFCQKTKAAASMFPLKKGENIIVWGCKHHPGIPEQFALDKEYLKELIKKPTRNILPNGIQKNVRHRTKYKH